MEKIWIDVQILLFSTDTEDEKSEIEKLISKDEPKQKIYWSKCKLDITKVVMFYTNDNVVRNHPEMFTRPQALTLEFQAGNYTTTNMNYEEFEYIMKLHGLIK